MSTLAMALLVALGAAIGAPLRYVLTVRLDGRFPTGLLLVNVIGSGLFGAFAAQSLSDQGWALLGVGLCGAFTSFSSFAVQSVELATRPAMTYVMATSVLSVAACTLGWVLGSGRG